MRRAVTCLAGILVVSIATGCSEAKKTAQITRTGAPKVTVRNGRLDQTPAPLNIRDVVRARRGSARQAFLLLWFYGQWGNAPGLPLLYDQQVRRAIGDSLIAGSYAADRVYMLETMPRIISVEHRGARTLVSVALLTISAPPSYQSFLFVRRGGQLRVMYDTFLESALAGYGQQLEQEKINPLAKKPAARAVAAGSRLAREFREVYLHGSATSTPGPVPGR